MSATCKTQVTFAPSQEPAKNSAKIFLAGTTNVSNDWRKRLQDELQSRDAEVTVFNPFRSDWAWPNDVSDPRFREQVEWELEKQEAANLIVVNLCPGTEAPISLMELGLCAKAGPEKIVVCPKGYSLRGNVQMVCERYRIEMLDSEEPLADRIVAWLSKSRRN